MANVTLDNITHLSRKNYTKIQQITNPLLNQFGITYFARQTVSNGGHWEIIGNCPEWLDHSADKGYYHIDPSLLHPDHYKSGITVNSSSHAPEFLREMANECLTLFDIDHTLCILNKTDVGCEWYFFATASKNINIISTYITHVKAIYNYINHFNQEAKRILHQNLDFAIKISDLKNQPFCSNTKAMELVSYSSKEEVFSNLKNYQITSREKDCLFYLICGKTIKETAKLLCLSPRTVEEYLINLRRKTGCKYKRDLIALFQNPSTIL